MTENNSDHNTIAPLHNVALCMAAMKRAMNRSQHLPGLISLYGPSGWGKSFSAAYVANSMQAYYIECKSSWTKRAILLAVLNEMGVAPGKNMYEMTDQISEQLVLSQRPLIIDEMDHIVDKKAVEIVRDIYEGSNAAILLIGEENLPIKLRRWERFHGRMLDWVPAQPATLKDAAHLAKLYCKEVEIGNDLLEKIVDLAKGSVRRICVNLEQVQSHSISHGLDYVSLTDWGNRKLFTGEAPIRRAV